MYINGKMILLKLFQEWREENREWKSEFKNDIFDTL
jgi:hypothetical protein